MPARDFPKWQPVYLLFFTMEGRWHIPGQTHLNLLGF
jgi:hypothetical protein